MKRIATICSVAITLLTPNFATGQAFPTRPVRIITSEPGGSGDVLSRLIAQGLTPALGQSVVVDNRPGIIAMEVVPQAAPDGYTLLFYNSGVWTLPFLQAVPYDPIKSFSPVIWVAQSPNILLVHPSLPVSSVKDLMALAKRRAGELNYASAVSGSSSQLAAELFKVKAGVNIVRIAYKGNGPALTALIGGEVQVMFATPASGLSHVKSGKLKGLAVTSAEPSALMPGLPTVAASGLPGYESTSLFGIWAPAGTPGTVVTRLNQEIARVLNQADVKAKFINIGVEPVGGSPEQFAAAINVDRAVWGKLIKDAGIKAE